MLFFFFRVKRLKLRRGRWKPSALDLPTSATARPNTFLKMVSPFSVKLFSLFSLTHPSFWRLWTLPAKISGSHIFWHSGWSCASAFLNTCVVYVYVRPIRSDGIKFPPSSSYFKGRVRERERGRRTFFGLHHDECRDGIGAESPRWTMIPWLGCVKGGGVLRFGRPNWEKNQKIEGIVTRGRPTKQKKCRQGKKWSWTLSWIWIGYAVGVVGVKFSFFFGRSSSSSSRNSVVCTIWLAGDDVLIALLTTGRTRMGGRPHSPH